MARRMVRINKNRIIMIAVAVLMVVGVGIGVFLANTYAKYVSSVDGNVRISIEKMHYTVFFDANGGEGSMEDQDFVHGVSQRLLPNTFTRSGFGFSGWNTEPDGTGQSFMDGAMVLNLVDSGTISLYAQWEAGEMQTVFRHDGACIFHGANGTITGDECTEYAGQKYIDTGIRLYSYNNYAVDYEIGFTINSYISDDNEHQATFFHDKYEDSSAGYPGIVVRKDSDNIEITQTVGGAKVQKKIPSGNVTSVKLVRLDGIVYYALNGSSGLTRLQSTLGTSDYFDAVTAWFGASATSDGAGQRYLTATLSNMYIKVGNNYSKRRIITLDAQGGTVSPSFVEVPNGRTPESMPNPTYGSKYFNGWFTEPNGGGTRISTYTVITSDMTAYAHWRDVDTACEVNGIEKNSLSDCVSLAGSSETPVMITLLKDQGASVTVNDGQNIVLGIGDYILSNKDSTSNVIVNYGKLTITDGILTSSASQGAINNESTGVLQITGGSILATGTRQAVYNRGGNLKISGTAFLSSTTALRPTVQNLSSGTVRVVGGTIESTANDAVWNESGTFIVGVEDGATTNASPVIQGKKAGIVATDSISFFDGVLRGGTAAINDQTKIAHIEEGASKVEDTVTIFGEDYHILYYVK